MQVTPHSVEVAEKEKNISLATNTSEIRESCYVIFTERLKKKKSYLPLKAKKDREREALIKILHFSPFVSSCSLP